MLPTFIHLGNMNKVLALVVTYNRLSDLKICVTAIQQQTYQGFDILIVNNGSHDGTKEWLSGQKGMVVINQNNLGGAGGFYTGMKYMYEHHQYEWLIMMDDDGIPDKEEFMNLITAYSNVSKKWGDDVILNALVVDKDNKEHTAFSWARGSGRTSNINELKKSGVFNDIHPFNGTLIKRSVITRIGFIKREMFIWGDEKEYTTRAKHNGIGLFTVPFAIHYHPKEKGKRENVIPFCKRFQILIKPVKMSHYYYRNEGFIYNTYPEKRNKMFAFVTAYIIYYFLHFKFNELCKFIKFFRKGMNNDYK